jgi:hypothetical protein
LYRYKCIWGLKAPTISPGKLNSLEKIVEQPSSQVPVKIAKIGVGALVGFVASIVPVTLVMACLAENGYIGRRNEK